MAKVKCSEIEEAIAELALDVAVTLDTPTVDNVLAAVNAMVGGKLNRTVLVDAVDKYTTGEAAKAADELKKKLASFKAEVKDDKAVNFAIENLQGQLETGFFQGPAPVGATSAASRTIKALRRRRDKLTTEKRLSERKAAVEKQIADKTVTQPKKLDLKDKGDPFDRLRDELKEVNAQLRQHREINDLMQQIESGVFKPRTPRRARKLSEARRRNQARLDLLRFDVRQHMDAMRPKTKRERLMDLASVPRSIMSSTDLSALGLQGWFNSVAHPIISAQQLGKSIVAAVNRVRSIDMHNEVIGDPMFQQYKDAGGYLAPVEGGTVDTREEAFNSQLAERIPVLGRLIKASSRAYVTFLNGLRFETWKKLMQNVPRGGDAETAAKEFARFTNLATGRGTFGKKGDIAVPWMNVFFFSVRNWASRLQMLTMRPLWGGNAQTRKIIAKEYAKFLGGSALMLVIGQAIGGEWEKDPRGSGFGKLRFGNTTIDLTAQLGSELHFLTKLITKQRKTRDGEIVPTVSFDFGKSDESEDVLTDKVRSKLSPMASLLYDWMTGKDFYGRPFDTARAFGERALPLSAQEVVEHFSDHNIPTASLLTMLSFLGFRPTTYDPVKRKHEMRELRRENPSPKKPKRLSL